MAFYPYPPKVALNIVYKGDFKTWDEEVAALPFNPAGTNTVQGALSSYKLVAGKPGVVIKKGDAVNYVTPVSKHSAPIYDKAQIASILGTLPPIMRTDSVIAGGYAAFPQLAGDIDVYILNCSSLEPEEREKVLEQIRKYQNAHGNLYLSSVNPNGEEVAAGYKTGSNVVVAGAGKIDGDERPIQYMLSDMKTAKELLATFDISTHRVALNEKGVLIKGKGFTGLKSSPKVLISTPDLSRQTLTLLRYQKICQRYGLKPHLPSIVQLMTPPPESGPETGGLELVIPDTGQDIPF